MKYYTRDEGQPMHQVRSYRNIIHSNSLLPFRVVVQETDLLVHAYTKLEQETKELVLQVRGYLEAFIKRHPAFATALAPWDLSEPAPNIVADMVNAGRKARVGPMAAVAGAIAEHVGQGLLKMTDHVIVENGGDIFFKTDTPVTVGIFAGQSPLSLQLGIRLIADQKPVAVCTSSGTVGHSLSFGNADAVCVVSHCCALADAAATSLANLIESDRDIETAIEKGKGIDGIRGLTIIVGNKIGMWGELEVVPLTGKKGLSFPHKQRKL